MGSGCRISAVWEFQSHSSSGCPARLPHTAMDVNVAWAPRDKKGKASASKATMPEPATVSPSNSPGCITDATCGALPTCPCVWWAAFTQVLGSPYFAEAAGTAHTSASNCNGWCPTGAVDSGAGKAMSTCTARFEANGSSESLWCLNPGGGECDAAPSAPCQAPWIRIHASALYRAEAGREPGGRTSSADHSTCTCSVPWACTRLTACSRTMTSPPSPCPICLPPMGSRSTSRSGTPSASSPSEVASVTHSMPAW